MISSSSYLSNYWHPAVLHSILNYCLFYWNEYERLLHAFHGSSSTTGKLSLDVMVSIIIQRRIELIIPSGTMLAVKAKSEHQLPLQIHLLITDSCFNPN